MSENDDEWNRLFGETKVPMQDETKAREVLASAGKKGWAEVIPADREAWIQYEDFDGAFADKVRTGSEDKTCGLQIMARHRAAFAAPPAVCASCGFPWGADPVRHAEMCDDRRAAPPAGELRDMPADDEIRLLREALTIYGDRVRMARSCRADLQQVIDYAFEYTPNRPAFGGDSDTRHPHQSDREAIARALLAALKKCCVGMGGNSYLVGNHEACEIDGEINLMYVAEVLTEILALSPTARDTSGFDLMAAIIRHMGDDLSFVADQMPAEDLQRFYDLRDQAREWLIAEGARLDAAGVSPTPSAGRDGSGA